MDYKQLIKDIFTLKISSFATRYYKMVAVTKRKLLLPADNFFTSKDLKQIPVIINNRNRLGYLKVMLEWLQKSGFTNIILLDNDSNYEPLLQFYKQCGHEVIYLKKNYGHLALWKSDVYKRFYNDYYVYTDPDLIPVQECPPDFMQHFMQLLNKYPGKEKVGFGLKINDLPDHYERKTEVISWEKKFWEREIEKDVFDAAIDTTFALYKPYTNGALWVQNALRTGGSYVMRHLPWYENSASPTEEDVFYRNNLKQGASHWIK